jgi:Holliday junction DNA helicase RuvA
VIGRLRGELIEIRGNRVVVDCHGVGYEAQVSAYTLGALEEGTPIDLRVHTHVTDRDLNLFGFATPIEREIFDLLITVKRVGPTAAIGILSSGATPSELAQLIAAEQTSALQKLKGVGKKTAEMLVVELHEKCEMLLATWGASNTITGAIARPAEPASSRPPILDDVASALVQLGWKKVEVDKVIDRMELTGDEELEELVRHALRNMPR